MHSTAALVIALALSTPALSAPVHTHKHLGLVRARDATTTADQSGASLFSLIPDVISGVEGLFGGNNKREIEEIFMRELLAARDDTESGASIFSTIAKAIPSVISGVEDLFGGNNNSQQQKRDVEDLLVRELLAARDDVESGASIFSTIAKAIPTVINGISSLFGGDNNNQQQKRDVEDLLVRELLAARDDVESGASIFSTIAKAIPSVISGISSLFGGDSNNQQQKRELEDLFMRALVEARSPAISAGISKIPVSVLRPVAARDVSTSTSTDQSGASIFSTIAKAIPDVISGVESLFGGNSNQNQRREIEEIFVRELVAARDDAESGASIFSTIAKAIPTVVSGISSLFGGDNNQKRELEHLVMREIFARAAEDESGASIFSTIAKAIPSVVSGISSLFGGDNNNKRDVEHLIMRELVTRAAADDASGASIFSTIAKAIPSVISGISSLFGGDNNNQQQKREVEHLVLREIFARAAAAADADASGASIFSTIVKAIPTVVSGISSLFGGDNNQKREIEHLVMRELVARAAEADQSGASIFSTIAKAIPSVISGISSLFGGDNNNQQQKRDIAELVLRGFLDQVPVARSLNELD